jgi:hypothetical protein
MFVFAATNQQLRSFREAALEEPIVSYETYALYEVE